MEKLNRKILYEQNLYHQMKSGNANIPQDWSLDKQEGFLTGLLHAYNMIKDDTTPIITYLRDLQEEYGTESDEAETIQNVVEILLGLEKQNG